MLQDWTYRIFKFWSSGNLRAGLRETYCHNLTAVILRVPYPQGILCIRFVFVRFTRFTTSSYGMYYLSLSINIHMVNEVADGTGA
jgi:hypothetical protein